LLQFLFFGCRLFAHHALILQFLSQFVTTS
jgi:hypothetical protein